MSTLMDYVASGIVFGILAISVAKVQLNINSTLYDNTFSIIVQQNAVQLALQIEHDFLKAGYRVASGAVSVADSTRLTFTSDLNNNHTIVTLAYTIGDSTQLPNTPNVHDFPLYRTEAGATVKQNWGLTYFRLAYYDSVMNKIPTPVSNKALIRAIQASFVIQSPEPVYTSYDTTWPAVTWQKLLYPRNLNNLE